MSSNRGRIPLRAILVAIALLIGGCELEPVRQFEFVEASIFPLPVDEWNDVTDEYTRKISFNCSFEDYAKWLVQIEGYKESVLMEFMDDPDKHLSEIVAYLSKKIPGEDYQGMYVGVDWIQDEFDPPIAIQISSHVYRPSEVSVEVVCSYF